MRRDGFVTEGTAIALPLCIPGLSAPPPADECRITALVTRPDGTVYLASGGQRAHLYAASTHSAGAAVVHLAALDSRRVVGVAAVATGLLAVTADPPQVVLVEQPWAPSHVLQEPFVPPFRTRVLAWAHDAAPRWVAAIPGATDALVGTDTALLRVDPEGRIDVVASGGFLVAPSAAGSAVVGAVGEHLWRWDGDGLDRDVTALTTPAVRLSQRPIDEPGVPLHVVDASSHVWRVDLATGSADRVGALPIAGAGPLATTYDGRAFGVCGGGIARLYAVDDRGVTDLGVMASAFGRRRYGYVFADAAIGDDGQVLLAEDDDLGHLWVYLPGIRRQ